MVKGFKLKLTKRQAVDFMLDAVTSIDSMKGSNSSTPAFVTWQRNATNVLIDAFGQGAVYVTKFLNIPYVGMIPLPLLLGDEKFREDMQRLHFDGGLNEARSILLAALRDLTHFPEDQLQKSAKGDKVFVVHGHDDLLRETVARFLERQGLKAIILQEQPRRGRTIIEQFEAYSSDVAYAVALLTPDDVVSSKSNSDQSRDRARQNVIFELGYFVGTLGRGHVACVRKGDVEIPSDLQGVLYLRVDQGNSWRYELGKELQAAGLKVDLNNI